MVTINAGLVATLLTEAAVAHPRECCGLLFGGETTITGHQPATNLHPTPQTHFEIDPQALIDAHRAMRDGGGPQVVGYYHSHPTGAAAPSATDQAMAAGDGMIWAIIASGELRLWRATGDGFSALSYTVI